MIVPELLIAVARLLLPPRVPRSVIVPLPYMKACCGPAAVSDHPTTVPALLIPKARLVAPPSVPMSVIVPLA